MHSEWHILLFCLFVLNHFYCPHNSSYNCRCIIVICLNISTVGHIKKQKLKLLLVLFDLANIKVFSISSLLFNCIRYRKIDITFSLLILWYAKFISKFSLKDDTNSFVCLTIWSMIMPYFTCTYIWQLASVWGKNSKLGDGQKKHAMFAWKLIFWCVLWVLPF